MAQEDFDFGPFSGLYRSWLEFGERDKQDSAKRQRVILQTYYYGQDDILKDSYFLSPDNEVYALVYCGSFFERAVYGNRKRQQLTRDAMALLKILEALGQIPKPTF